MSDLESEFDMSGETSYDVVILKKEKYEGIKTEIARLEEENRKLREAVISERFKLRFAQIAGTPMWATVKSTKNGGEVELTSAPIDANELMQIAESELRAEGVIN